MTGTVLAAEVITAEVAEAILLTNEPVDDGQPVNKKCLGKPERTD